MPVLSDLTHAVASFGFRPKGGGRPRRPLALVGTGALIHHSRDDGALLFLTARHHFLFGEGDIRYGIYPSFEAIWDYTVEAPGAFSAEALAKCPRSRGAVLLASDEKTDSALLRLENAPPGRTFLGWTRSQIEEWEFHRLSHPYGFPQTHSRHLELEPFETVGGSVLLGAPRRAGSSFYRFYQTSFTGRLGPGSSGAPLVTSNLRVVGQLWGVCEKNNVAYALDGAFVHAYPQLRLWLDPSDWGEVPAKCI